MTVGELKEMLRDKQEDLEVRYREATLIEGNRCIFEEWEIEPCNIAFYKPKKAKENAKF